MPSIVLTNEEKQIFDEISIKNFQEYLRIPSVHPDVNYDDCVKFLRKQAESLDLPFKICNLVPKKPIVILTWIGLETNLPTIMLNSHMDVVPVYEDKWTHKPFNADIEENGNIYARGAQDMKSVGIQYLEAVRRLKSKGIKLKRTVHITFMPDEEIGGADGMQKFAKSDEFRALNVGVAFDEGAPFPTKEIVMFYGERCIWHMHVHCPGQAGHGSLLLDNTAGEKVSRLLDRVFEFRKGEKQKLEDNPQLMMGDVTAINLTMLSGGVQSNVIPPEFVVVFDCRIAVTVDLESWQETINKWCEEAGSGTWVEYELKQSQVPVTKLDNSNPYWVAFDKVAKDIGVKLQPVICPGGTDARYLREIGVPCFGFSPLSNTEIRLHDNDEYLNKNVFLRGIEIYCEIIGALANLPDKM